MEMFGEFVCGYWGLKGERFDVIQARPPFCLLTKEDKRKLCSQGE